MNNNLENQNNFILINWPETSNSMNYNNITTKNKPISYYLIYCIQCKKETNIKSLNILKNTLSCLECNNSYNFSIINCDICMKNSYAITNNKEYVTCSCGIQYNYIDIKKKKTKNKCCIM